MEYVYMLSYRIVADHLDGGEVAEFVVDGNAALRRALSAIESLAADRGLNVSCRVLRIHYGGDTNIKAWLDSLGGIEPPEGDMVDLSGPLVIHPPDPIHFTGGDYLPPLPVLREGSNGVIQNLDAPPTMDA